jgi:hypothetical protein
VFAARSCRLYSQLLPSDIRNPSSLNATAIEGITEKKEGNSLETHTSSASPNITPLLRNLMISTLFTTTRRVPSPESH